MLKRIILAILAIFVTWSVIDFFMHGLILSTAYHATAQLWRPMDEMNMGLIYLTVLVFSAVFVCIYAWFFGKKGIWRALIYGLLLGIGVGISFAYGTYAVMPIPYYMALTWFVGTIVETTLGGLLLGLIIRK